MAAVLREAGGEATCEIRGDLPHVWPLMQGWLPEADADLRFASAFIRAVLTRR